MREEDAVDEVRWERMIGCWEEDLLITNVHMKASVFVLKFAFLSSGGITEGTRPSSRGVFL